MASLGNSLKPLERSNTNSIQSIPENEKQRIFPIHSLRPPLLWHQNQTQTLHENNTSTSSVVTGAKINERLAD